MTNKRAATIASGHLTPGMRVSDKKNTPTLTVETIRPHLRDAGSVVLTFVERPGQVTATTRRTRWHVR